VRVLGVRESRRRILRERVIESYGIESRDTGSEGIERRGIQSEG